MSGYGMYDAARDDSDAIDALGYACRSIRESSARSAKPPTDAAPHMLVTGYLGAEDQAAVYRLIDQAAQSGLFREVLPVRRPDGRIIAVAFLTAAVPMRQSEWQAGMRPLDGILSRDTVIAGPPGMWTVRGGGAGVRGEVIREPEAPRELR